MEFIYLKNVNKIITDQKLFYLFFFFIIVRILLSKSTNLCGRVQCVNVVKKARGHSCETWIELLGSVCFGRPAVPFQAPGGIFRKSFPGQPDDTGGFRMPFKCWHWSFVGRWGGCIDICIIQFSRWIAVFVTTSIILYVLL